MTLRFIFVWNIGGSKGVLGASLGPNLFHFHAAFGKNQIIGCFCPKPRAWRPGNPEFVTVEKFQIFLESLSLRPFSSKLKF